MSDLQIQIYCLFTCLHDHFAEQSPLSTPSLPYLSLTHSSSSSVYISSWLFHRTITPLYSIALLPIPHLVQFTCLYDHFNKQSPLSTPSLSYLSLTHSSSSSLYIIFMTISPNNHPSLPYRSYLSLTHSLFCSLADQCTSSVLHLDPGTIFPNSEHFCQPILLLIHHPSSVTSSSIYLAFHSKLQSHLFRS